MRLARIAVILSVILLGTTSLRAQPAHSNACDTCDGCGVQGCEQGCGCQACAGNCSLLSDLSAKLTHALGGILPGGAGCDGRHKIYKAALQRNSFDKKFLLPVAYYSHIFPMYSHKRCCCGSATTTANCPTCGPHGAMGEEVIETDEVPMPMPPEPTPAVDPQVSIVPGAVVPPRRVRDGSATRSRTANQQRAHRNTSSRSSSDRLAQQSQSNVKTAPTLRNFAPLVLRPETRQEVTVRQVSAVEERIAADPANPLR